MGDQHDGSSGVAGEVEQAVHHLRARMRIEIAGRFVGQQNIGIIHQGPGDRRALLFAAGEFGWTVVQAVAQAHAVQQFRRARGMRPTEQERVPSGPRR